jgi:hypothetical protein
METREAVEAPEPGLTASGVVDAPLATAAALDSTTFAGLNPNEGIPATWEERARKAWEYYPCLRRFTHTVLHPKQTMARQAGGIKRTLLTGIATGKGAGDIVRDFGSVIEDKDSFR